jgi:hypothetical protein
VLAEILTKNAFKEQVMRLAILDSGIEGIVEIFHAFPSWIFKLQIKAGLGGLDPQ